MRWVLCLFLLPTVALGQSAAEDRKWIAKIKTGGVDMVAAQAYFERRGSAATSELSRALLQERGAPGYRASLMWAAAWTKDPSILPAVFEACRRVPYPYIFDSDVVVTSIRLDEFGTRGYDKAAEALTSKNFMVRRVATQLLTYSTQEKLTPKAQGALSRARHDKDPYVAVNSTYFASWVGPQDYARMLPFTHHSDPRIRINALEAAARGMPTKAKALRIEHLDDPDELVAGFAMNDMRYGMDQSDFAAVARVLARAKGQARLHPIEALGYVRNDKAIPVLTPLIDDSDREIAGAAMRSLAMVRGG